MNRSFLWLAGFLMLVISPSAQAMPQTIVTDSEEQECPCGYEEDGSCTPCPEETE